MVTQDGYSEKPETLNGIEGGQTPVAGATGGPFDTLDKEWMTTDNFSGGGGGNRSG